MRPTISFALLATAGEKPCRSVAYGSAGGDLPAPPPWVQIGPTAAAGYVGLCPDDPSQLCKDGKPHVFKGVNYFLWAGERDSGANLENDFSEMQARGINTVLLQAEGFNLDGFRSFVTKATAYDIHVVAYGSPCEDPTKYHCPGLPRSTLADLPGVAAFDLCWECAVRGTGMAEIANAFQVWLNDRYSGEAARVFDGHLPTPIPNSTRLCQSAPDRDIAIYRRFVADHYGWKFAQEIANLRISNPHQLFTFRNGLGGNGWEGVCHDLPLDIRTAAYALDAIAPEGYHLWNALLPPNTTGDPASASESPACADGVPHRPPDPACRAPTINASTIMRRSAFTYAYADVGKPILLFEYGVPVRCPTEAWREAQQRDWEATARAAAAKNISGVFPWLFVDRNAAGGYGGVYNEYLFWSANDTAGQRSRDANLQLCSAVMSSYENNTTHSNSKPHTPRWSLVAGDESQCPNAAFAVHSFLDGENATYTLCSHQLWRKRQRGEESDAVNDAATLAGGLFATCPAEANNTRGSFLESSAPGARNLTLCLSNGDISGLWIYNSSYGRQPSLSATCPDGTIPAGKFRPQAQPLFLPSLDSYAQALYDFDTTTPRKREYISYVTVDPEEGAGRWKMWETGFEAMRRENPTGVDPVGVQTICSDSNSSATGGCVGGTSAGFSCASSGANNSSGCVQTCPWRCLNAELVALWLRSDLHGAQWVNIANGSYPNNGSFTLMVRHSFSIAAQVGNTAEAMWLPSSTGLTAGAVSLVLTTQGDSSGTRSSSRGGANSSFISKGRVIGRLSLTEPIGWMETAQLGPSIVNLPPRVTPPPLSAVDEAEQSSVVMLRARMQAVDAATNVVGASTAAAGFGPSFALRIVRMQQNRPDES